MVVEEASPEEEEKQSPLPLVSRLVTIEDQEK